MEHSCKVWLTLAQGELSFKKIVDGARRRGRRTADKGH